MAALDNPRHEAFAQSLAKGCPQLEAYTSAGYKPNEGHASRLAGNGKVASRVRELQEASAEAAVVSAAELSDQLEDIRVKATAANQFGAAAQAVMGRAKLHGLIIDKAEVKDVTPPLEPSQRKSEIERLLAKQRPHLRVVGG